MNRATASGILSHFAADRRRAASDRRGSRRLPFVAAVRQGQHLGQACDLGLEGMRVRRRCHTQEPVLPARTPLHVAFELPGGHLLEVAAEVVFDQPQARDPSLRSTGLRFAELPTETADRLRSFLKTADKNP